jgi:hypothetical protein
MRPISSCSIVHDLADVAHWGTRDAVTLDDREHLHLAEGRCPRADESVGLVDMCDAVGTGLETRVVARVLATDCGQQIMPMLLDRDVDRDIAVIGAVDASGERAWLRLPVRGGTLPDCQ